MQIKKNFPLKKFTTMAIGGPAKFFVAVENETELAAAVAAAKASKLPWVVVGGGSNLIVADKGYKGVIIQNGIKGFVRKGIMVQVGAGDNLLQTILRLDRLGLSGMEKMAGIPGTIGGAIYGCAGAYGQEIKDCLRRVKIFDGRKFRNLKRAQCRFGYRGSIFKKHKDWIILSGEFRFKMGEKGGRGEKGKLTVTSRKIIKLRAKKYPPGLKCPGSFFKNIKLADLPAAARGKLLRKISPDTVMYGKVPAGKLLEEIGAKGMNQGRIAVARHHANLIFNPGRGTARDVSGLAHRLKGLVKKKFGITIQEEVQYLP